MVSVIYQAVVVMEDESQSYKYIGLPEGIFKPARLTTKLLSHMLASVKQQSLANIHRSSNTTKLICASIGIFKREVIATVQAQANPVSAYGKMFVSSISQI